MVCFLEEAKERLKNEGYKITAARKDVISVIKATDKALGPYEIKDLLEERGKNYEVITVYRVVELLNNLDLLHKIYSINSYIKCRSEHKHDHRFLVCKNCHEIEILDSSAEKPKRKGFKTQLNIEESLGICESCS